MARARSLLLLLLFGAFVTAPLVATAVGVKGGGTALQNRSLAKLPRLTWRAVWSGKYGKDFSDWVWDAIPLRDKLLKANHHIDYAWFGDSPSPDGVFGLNGFSWRRERIVQGIRAGSTPPADITKALDKIEAAFDDAGVPLAVVVSPSKASIYPEYLPDGYREEFHRLSWPAEETFRDRAKNDPRMIELWTPFLEEKQRLMSLPESELARPELRYLWKRNDDHWNVEAGHIQAREIVKHFDPSLWDEAKSPHPDGKFQMQEAELSRLYFKLDIMEPYQGLKWSDLIHVAYKHVNIAGSHYQLILTHSSDLPTNTPKKARILVVRDSFLSDHSGRPSCTRDGGIQTIAPFFEDGVFLHWDTWQGGADLVKPYLKDVDFVVIQVTQASNYYLVRRADQMVKLAQAVKEGRAAPAMIGPQLPPPDTADGVAPAPRAPLPEEGKGAVLKRPFAPGMRLQPLRRAITP